MLLNWLARFHVSPRDTLPEEMARLAAAQGKALSHNALFRTYAVHARLS